MTEKSENPQYPNYALIEAMRKQLEEAIKAKEGILSLPVEYRASIGGRILPMTSLYEVGVFGEPAFMIDGLSQHGFLSLINVQALRAEDGRNLYEQDLGTYDRDQNRKMTAIYLDIVEKNLDLSQIIFGKSTLQQLLEDNVVWTYSGGGGSDSTFFSSIFEQATFAPMK